MAQSTSQKIGNLMGQDYKGEKWFDSSTAKDTTNTFHVIHVITDTVFADLEDANANIADTGGVLNAQSVTAPAVLYGAFTDIDLTSGVIKCFSLETVS